MIYILSCLVNFSPFSDEVIAATVTPFSDSSFIQETLFPWSWKVLLMFFRQIFWHSNTLTDGFFFFTSKNACCYCMSFPMKASFSRNFNLINSSNLELNLLRVDIHNALSRYIVKKLFRMICFSRLFGHEQMQRFKFSSQTINAFVS